MGSRTATAEEWFDALKPELIETAAEALGEIVLVSPAEESQPAWWGPGKHATRFVVERVYDAIARKLVAHIDGGYIHDSQGNPLFRLTPLDKEPSQCISPACGEAAPFKVPTRSLPPGTR